MVETAAPGVEEPSNPRLYRGQPGASAVREYRRRRSNREARTRASHPYLGGLILALKPPPQHETAWSQGGRGEESVARQLERRTANRPAVLLHDRLMPGGYGNIDHLAVAPRGVYVIDTKAVKGKVRVRRAASGASKLQVNGRTRGKLIAGLGRQVSAVRAALDAADRRDVLTTGVLCFTEADFPLFGRMQIDGYLLRHCRALGKELNAVGPLTPDVIDPLARNLAQRFRPA